MKHLRDEPGAGNDSHPSRIKFARNRAPSASSEGQAVEVEANAVR